MKRTLLALITLHTVQFGFAQGFGTTAANWDLPSGGYLSPGITNGYYLLAGASANLGETNSENWSMLDMNGDARPDLVVTGQKNSNGQVQEFSPGSGSYWKVYINNGTDFSSSATNWSLPSGGYLSPGITNGYYLIAGASANLGEANSENWSVLDMNGDAKPDLVVTGQKNSNGQVQEFSPGSGSYWKVYINTGNGFSGSATNWSLPSGGYLSPGITNGYYLIAGASANLGETNSENWSVIDMNGDAKPDLVVTGQKNSNGQVQEFSPGSGSYWKVYINTGNDFSSSATNWSLPSGGYLSPGVTNGYYLIAGASANLGETNSENWSVIDLSNDGKPDLVVTGQKNSNGQVQEFSPSSGSYWKVYINTGNGFSSSATNWSLPNGGYLSPGITNGYYLLGGGSANLGETNSENWSVIDLNDDGKPDLVVTGQKNSNGQVQEFSPGSNSYWKVYFNTGSAFNTNATNWGLPSGGYLSPGITNGYYLLGGASANLGETNSENWSVLDMNGDGAPELVITGQKNSNGQVQEFSPGSNSYWKVYWNGGSTGLDELDAESGLVVFPNPATDHVELRSVRPLDEVLLFDAQGRLVYSDRPGGTATTIAVNGISPGAYLLRTRSQSITHAQRIIIH